MGNITPMLLVLSIKSMCYPLSYNNFEESDQSDHIPTVRAREGSNVVLTCAGWVLSPDTTVSWLRSESLQIISVEYLVFTHDNRYSLSRSMELTIARVSPQDSGQYECQMVDKSLGSMTKHIVELRVETDKYRDPRLQHDDPQLLLAQNDKRRVGSNNEREKTLNKLMEQSDLRQPEWDVSAQGVSDSNVSWPDLQLPIISLVLMVIFVMVLGLVRTLGSAREENVTSTSSASSHQNISNHQSDHEVIRAEDVNTDNSTKC